MPFRPSSEALVAVRNVFVTPLDPRVQDRGGVLFDPPTKSTRQKASVYLENDVCGQPAYIVAKGADSYNGTDDECQAGLLGTVSISVRVPSINAAGTAATSAEIEANIGVLTLFLSNYLQGEVNARLSATP